MDTLYTSWDNVTHYKTESVHFLGLMNSATKVSLKNRERSRQVSMGAKATALLRA